MDGGVLFMASMLPGERPEPADVEDAEHWLLVYRELQVFLRGLFDTYAADGYGLEDDRVRALTTRMGWINQRLRFWEERQRDLRRASGGEFGVGSSRP